MIWNQDSRNNEQKEILKDIADQISEVEKKVAAKEKNLDKILNADKSVEKEISESRSQVSDATSFFGGEPMDWCKKWAGEMILPPNFQLHHFLNFDAVIVDSE